MSLSIEPLLPLHGVIVTLRFRQAGRFGFFHQPALSAFLRYLLNSPPQFDSLIRLDACESGRIQYAAGAYYRFTVYALNGGQALLRDLIKALRQLPASAVKNDPAMPLRRNCELLSLHDVFSGRALDHADQPGPYGVPELLAECRLWQSVPRFHIQFLSPVRLLKDKAARGQLKGEARYCRQHQDLSASLLADRLHDNFAALLGKQGGAPAPARPQAEPLGLSDDSHLFWLDVHYSDADRNAHPMGGMTGKLTLDVPEPENFAWDLWVLGQYTGFGQRCAFGWGRYQLQTMDGELSCRRAFPAASLLSAVKAGDNLLLALAHINSNTPQADSALEPELNDPDEGLLERLEQDIERLFNGEFLAPTLQGVILTKADGSPRPLAVPPFRDRVLQRAVVQVLQPITETIQSPHSYGYRPGRSRITARYAIQSAWREGYRWVYEADIEDFFDTVCWQRLEIKLRALWGDNEPLVAGLLAWLQAPVEYAGQVLQRRCGLPQGSPLSPLLANLMLDDFDADMQTAGFKLIRYADDFVVLCKSKEKAEAAHQAALMSLAEHGLQLNAEKTRIGEMADGFHYLGYLFVNDMALESPEQTALKPTAAAVSPHSWLANIAVRPVKALLTPETEQPSEPMPVFEQAPTVADAVSQQAAAIASGERLDHGLLLCISGEPADISSHQERIHIQRDEQTLYQAPWRHLQAVLLLGRHRITGPALTTAMKFNVPLHFASGSGKYQGVVWNGQSAAEGCRLWLKQQQVFAVPEQALTLSRDIVSARLQHIRETLRLRQQSSHIAQLEALILKLPSATSLAELNGLEGAATRGYFLALREIVPSEFGFNGRNRQPPQDPFNALLSLGYTLLYSCVESILRCDGLLPWQGFYHQPHGRHATLASDLMEPFRHIVERQALAMLKRHELKPADFYRTEQQACYLNKTARNLYLAKLVAKFDSRVSAKNSAEPQTLFSHIHQQNLSLIRYLEQGAAFNAWRIR